MLEVINLNFNKECMDIIMWVIGINVWGSI